MINVDLAFVPPASAPDVAIVIDVLRMTTTATTLFSRNLAELAVVADSAAALALEQESGALLLGERHGLPLPGFDGGNSPLDHLESDLSGRHAILCTTNGSKAVEAMAEAAHVLLGAIVNDRAVAKRALQLTNGRISVICAGTDGQVSLDDVLGAGCILQELSRLEPGARFSDSCRIALMLAERSCGIDDTLRQARHADTLGRLGFINDIHFAARRNSFQQVPERFAMGPARFTAFGSG
jgi:2-phosphosulfolactate phosphatase